MNKRYQLDRHLPLIAILRGVTPESVLDVAKVLVEEGFGMIEVPLNSPEAIESIRLLVDTYGEDLVIGAGTVVSEQQADEVISTGANLMVTPNMNEQVIAKGVAAGCAVFPGVVTPTEAFAALAAGATGLKFFPVSLLGVDGIKALRSVLPAGTQYYPVGGIEPTIESMAPYHDAGAAGFGLGSALYKSDMSLEEIRRNASDFVNNFKRLNEKT